MNLTDDFTLKFQCGVPVLLEDICAIYPRTLRDIAEIGYSNFEKYLGIITIEKPDLDKKNNKELVELIKDLSNFQYLLLIASTNMEINEVLKSAFNFFIKDSIMLVMDPAEIIVGPAEENHILTEDKFYELQQIIRRMYCLDTDPDDIEIHPEDSEAIKKLKRTMKKNREKVKKAKRKESGNSDLKFSDLIGSVTINDCGLNILNIWDITYYAFHDQLKRMGWRDQFNINNRAALAGAKLNKDQLKHWMRSINSDTK